MKKKSCINLFVQTFLLSAFTLGGGYTIVSLMQKKFVEEFKWIDKDEMLNIVSIAQSAPGAIVINTSILLGYNLKGIKGAIVTTFATVLPPLIIISFIAFCYNSIKDNAIVSNAMRAVRAGVAAIISGVVINMAKDLIKTKNIFYIVLMIICFCINFFLDINLIFILLGCIIIGVVYTYIKTKELI